MVLPGTAFAGTTSDAGRTDDRIREVQYLSLNPGLWCSWYAHSQLSKAVGINFNYVGLAGSERDNSLACRMIVAGGPGERVGSRWYGANGAAPEYRVLVDFQQACSLQYSGTTAAWVDANTVRNSATHVDDWIKTSGWYCTGEAGHGYNESSRPMK
jgi:hypothetical protein